MTLVDDLVLEDEQRAQMESWRLAVATELGFGPVQAAHIAERLSIDLHELERLVTVGCPLGLAARIADEA